MLIGNEKTYIDLLLVQRVYLPAFNVRCSLWLSQSSILL